MLAGDLELPVDALQLVAGAVHPRGEPADLVAVRDVEAAGEVAGADLGESFLGAAERSDHRPREEQPECQRQRQTGRADSDQKVAGAGERVVVGGDERIGASAGRAGEPAELDSQGSRERGAPAEGPLDREGAGTPFAATGGAVLPLIT